MQPHSLWVTTLSLVTTRDTGALSYAAISCGGDNLCKLTMASSAELERARTQAQLMYGALFALVIALLSWLFLGDLLGPI